MSYYRGKGGKVVGEGRGAGRQEAQEGPREEVHRGKGGKVLGGGRGVGPQEAVEGSGEDVVWLARDVRLTGRGGQGTGGCMKPDGAKPKRWYSCATCHDNCCGLARELVATAFKLGKVTMSPKVMMVVICFWGLVNFTGIRSCNGSRPAEG